MTKIISMPLNVGYINWQQMVDKDLGILVYYVKIIDGASKNLVIPLHKLIDMCKSTKLIMILNPRRTYTQVGLPEWMFSLVSSRIMTSLFLKRKFNYQVYRVKRLKYIWSLSGNKMFVFWRYKHRWYSNDFWKLYANSES